MHARLHRGPLGQPQRNDLRTQDADDLTEVEQTAKELAADGYTVWIYDHGNAAVSPGGSNYRTILKYTPDGRLVDLR